MRGWKITEKWQKMHFNGQNQKKWRKRTLIIFWFYIKMCPPTFSGPPLGGENDIFSKNRTCLIWWHISPEPLTCPECKNIGLTLWPIRKTSFRFGGHVMPSTVIQTRIFEIFFWLLKLLECLHGVISWRYMAIGTIPSLIFASYSPKNKIYQNWGLQKWDF